MKSRKMALMNLQRAGTEMQTERTDLWIQQGKERVGQIESSVETYKLLYVK